jgi:catechol 2,3-dioxygenase-like lactoylglutathione lyase family enzyme
MQAERILETCLYVDDLEAAETFYREVLGLIPFSQVKDRHIFFRCGAAVLLLFNPLKTTKAEGDVPTHGAHGAGHVAFAMSSEDIPAWREQLTSFGVTIETELTWPSGGFSLYFRDPAGNSLELVTLQTWGLSP